MKCNDFLLEDYVEGFLTNDERTELETHISSCSKCQQTLENLRTEQMILTTTLNEPKLRSNLTDDLMQKIKNHNKTKAKRQRYHMMVIAAAILLISFTLMATMNNSNQQADTVLLPDVSGNMDAAQPNFANTIEEPITHGIPLNEGPVLDIKIDSVIEKNGMKKITYRRNYNEAIQQYSEVTLKKLVTTYDIDERLFHLSWDSLISIFIRNSKNEVVTTFEIKESEDIKPIYPLVGQYHQATEVLGEKVTHFSLPVETDPTFFEIESYFVQLYTFAEPFTFKKGENTSFNYLGHTYTIYETQLKDGDLRLHIKVDGQPEIIPYGWQINIDGKNLRNFIHTFHKVENNNTFINVIIREMETIPEEMTLLPYRGLLEEKFEPPIILDLKGTPEK